MSQPPTEGKSCYDEEIAILHWQFRNEDRAFECDHEGKSAQVADVCGEEIRQAVINCGGLQGSGALVRWAGGVSLLSSRIRASFGFIDLAGYTALTEVQGDEDAADVAIGFAKLTRAVLGPGDRLVKSIGDAVLVTSPDPASGVDLVERVLIAAARDIRLPALRAGLHHGEAVERQGDVFGAAVNLAARVAAEAHAGEVLGTEPIADAARAAGIPVAPLGNVVLKNVRQSVPLFSLALVVGATDTPVDPVCRQPVDRRGASGTLRYRGMEFWFCSLTCAAAFASNPGWHAAESLRPRSLVPKDGKGSGSSQP